MASSTVMQEHSNPSWFTFVSTAAFIALIAAGGIYAGSHIFNDLSVRPLGSTLPYVLLGIALLIALGFEFVNGFHDTANAVATVIYTHSLPPTIAVMWSGLFNFIGVLTSSGLVAWGIVSLLPVELILQVGSGAGFAMVFALLIAAIIWNLGTWAFGIPNSSSHALIGSIIGVGLMNQLLATSGNATSGVDWNQAWGVIRSLLVSPVVGFVSAAVLLLLMKALIKVPSLYKEPEGNKPPPVWIRGLLILTCTGVSFAHGSNDGQKGMGLIMLILIGTVPTVYALNPNFGGDRATNFQQTTQATLPIFDHYGAADAEVAGDPREAVTAYIRTKTITPETMPAVKKLAGVLDSSVELLGKGTAVPEDMTKNVRNDMYLEGESLRLMDKSGKPEFTAEDKAQIKKYRAGLDNATKFIPDWVKVAVALALGLGTMVGWKRIVVTVGEKIGKTHLTYAQGASAELVAMVTIGAADMYGLPVSTTHVLSSGVAGTMAANKSGLQMATMRSLAMAWILTLPASITLAAILFWLFRQMF